MPREVPQHMLTHYVLLLGRSRVQMKRAERCLTTNQNVGAATKWLLFEAERRGSCLKRSGGGIQAL